MAVRTYAAVTIGSAETEMRIYEYSSRGMREIDQISTRINLGVDAYSEGRLDSEKVRDLVEVLREFRSIMDGYKVSDYRICATSALREIRSGLLMQDYIEKQTGLKMHIISNSEQRFLDYKAIAFGNPLFDTIIQKGTAIADIGGSSMQISVFDKDRLITTQNIRMGKISSREKYLPEAKNARHFEKMLSELLEHEMAGFGKIYQKDRQILNLIVVDPELLQLIEREGLRESANGPDKDEVFHIDADEFYRIYDDVILQSPDALSEQYQLAPESAQMLIQSMIFCRVLLDRLGAQTLWVTDISICDGLAYDYGVSTKNISAVHNFDEDIIAASRSISKRYKSPQAHIRNMEELGLGIFDKLRKSNGMKKRDRLLLQIAIILHNCGKFISLTNVSDCAYNIIMATEIIGLSHDERRIIANVVRFNTLPFQFYTNISSSDPISREEYLLIAKLTAILRIANALDRSHKQKCAGASINLRDDELVISVSTKEDLSLEKITLIDRAPFFEEVFHVHPVLRQKKTTVKP